MRKLSFIALIYLFLLTACSLSLVAQEHNDEEFITSFIKHYEFSPEGRYVHEYHPFILKKTIESFNKLEKFLTDQGFNLIG